MRTRDQGYRRPASILFILGILAVALGAGPMAIPDGPSGYWPGDDGSSGTALDLSGVGNNGTYTNSASTNAASKAPLNFPNASSISVNGVNQYVNVPTFSWPTGGPVTVSYWSYVASADKKQASTFSVGNQDTPNRFQCHGPWSDGSIYWDYGTATTGNGRVSTDYSSHFDAWTHVALVSQGAGGTFQAIYLNGSQAVSASTSTGPTAPLSGLTIGAWTSAGFYVKGLIDDFRIYDRVLSDPEIAALAAGDGGPAAATGLTAVPSNFKVSLNWSDSTGPGPITYTVGRSLVMGGSPPGVYAPIASGLTSPSYDDTTVTNGTQYYYVVYADSFGQSGPSNEATTTPNSSVVQPTRGKGSMGCHATAAQDPGALPFIVGLGVLALLLVQRR